MPERCSAWREKVIIFIQHSHSMYNCLPLYYLIEKLSCIGAHVSQDSFKFNKSTHDARAMLGMERKSTLVTTLEYDSIQILCTTMSQ